MKLQARHIHRLRAAASGFTLIELMVSVGLGALLLGVVAILFINGSWSFVAMGNYQDLDVKSMKTLDIYSKEIRNATGLIAYTAGTSLTLTNTTAGTGTKFTYNSAARTLVMTKTGQAAVTNLTECDSWDFTLYNKAPNPSSTNITFYAATNAAACKLISMTWKTSRKIRGSKLNTESVQTAQVVMRNKVN